MPVAITREVPSSLDRCELTHIKRRPIDVVRAREQHAAYEQALTDLGCRIVKLPEDAGMPDSVFVEDTAVVVDECAIVARPGAPSRSRETADVATVLRPFRSVHSIVEPATLDGGDVLRIGRKVFIGASRRTNRDGVAQLRAILEPRDYRVIVCTVRGCLHLKSAVTQVGPSTVLINRNWTDVAAFREYEIIDVDPDEPHAANALWVHATVVHPAAFPRTRERLERAGVLVRPVNLSELAKAEAGVTCCSLIVHEPKPGEK